MIAIVTEETDKNHKNLQSERKGEWGKAVSAGFFEIIFSPKNTWTNGKQCKGDQLDDRHTNATLI